MPGAAVGVVGAIIVVLIGTALYEKISRRMRRAARHAALEAFAIP